MAWSLNGVGTMFYGKRDFLDDGTYLTTEWVTFFYIPIVPLKTLRVYYEGPTEPRFPLFITTAGRYQVLAKCRPHLKQVLFTYGFVLFVIMWEMSLIDRVIQIASASIALSACFLGALVPIPLPWVFRKLARKQAQLKTDV